MTRISPEAPVPIVVVRSRTTRPGGAANAAANASALGARVLLSGVVGHDPQGDRLLGQVRELGSDIAAVVSSPGWPTTTKTRVLAHTQQIARIDQEEAGPPPQAVADELCRHCLALVPSAGAVVISDYGKGVVTPELARDLIGLCRNHSVPVIVDPKGADISRYRGASVVKPNLAEAAQVLGRDLHTDTEARRAGVDLLKLLGSETAVLLTRGPAGMILFEPGREPFTISARAQAVYDVTGAGDTVAATLAVSLAEGMNLPTACRRAALAAGVVVGKVGTAVCTRAELESAEAKTW